MSCDSKLFFCVVGLIVFGVIMVYSLSAYTVVHFGYSGYHFLMRQLISAVLGIMAIWMISQLDPDKSFKKFGMFIFFVSVALIVLMPFLPESMASSAGGAKRWIRLPGISIAPSELFKIGFVFFLSWSFSRKFSHKKIKIKEEFKMLIPYGILFAVIGALIVVLQNDLGQVVLLAITLCVMLLFAGGSFQLIGILFSMAIFVGSIVIFTSPHRILRIKSWWANAQDSVLSILPNSIADYVRVENLPEPYQVYHAGNAISNGGFIGEGIGAGVVKLGFLSEVHTDMILAGISEEVGFLGLFCVVLAIGFILYRIFKISNRVENNSYHLFCVGMASLIGFAFVINSFGVSGLIPIKGIAVPFLSYGGSSLIANCIGIGMILSISKKQVSTPNKAISPTP